MIPRIPGEPPRDLSRPLEEIRLRIDPRAAGERLDKALVTYLPWRSRSSIQRLIEDGAIDVGGQRGRPSMRVRDGDVVVVRIPPRAVVQPVADTPEALTILHEDPWMVAVDKPAGMAVHPAGRTLSGTLIQVLHARYRRDEGPRVVPRLAHRIDRETSGVVVVGLDDDFHSVVARQFEDRLAQKTYLAVVEGRPNPPAGLIDLGIGPARRSVVRLKLEARQDGSGAPALTRYRVLKSRGRYSLVELEPKTGRTHQIRVHMAAIGTPLVGDKIYGPDERLFLDHLAGTLSDADRERLVLPRHALHAHRLRFHHPRPGRELQLEAPLPADLGALVD